MSTFIYEFFEIRLTSDGGKSESFWGRKRRDRKKKIAEWSLIVAMEAQASVEDLGDFRI